jgi:hypothetical protein
VRGVRYPNKMVASPKHPIRSSLRRRQRGYDGTTRSSPLLATMTKIGVGTPPLLLGLLLLLLTPLVAPTCFRCLAFSPPPSSSSSYASAVASRRRRASAAVAELSSVPTPLDTFASGLASISRLPRGVSVVPGDGVSMSGPAASFLPVLKKMYDVENDRDCRRVRERITELDLIVGKVVPCGMNSGNNRAEEAVPLPTLVAEVDGMEVVVSGADDVLRFLDESFSAAAAARWRGGVDDRDEVEEGEGGDDATPDATAMPRRIARALSDLTSYLPSVLRLGRGTTVCTASTSTSTSTSSAAAASTSSGRSTTLLPLVLYSYEGNQFCRLVREVLTELDVVYELRSCGKGSCRRGELSDLTGGSTSCPYLIDPNTGVAMAESGDIVGE